MKGCLNIWEAIFIIFFNNERKSQGMRDKEPLVLKFKNVTLVTKISIEPLLFVKQELGSHALLSALMYPVSD